MRYLLFILVFATCNSIYAQKGRKNNELKDSTFTIPMITANYGMDWKAGDISNRFGSNNAVGGSFVIKNKKNWYYGVKGNYNWGTDVKESTILDNIKTSEDMVIDNEEVRILSDLKHSSGSHHRMLPSTLLPSSQKLHCCNCC